MSRTLIGNLAKSVIAVFALVTSISANGALLSFSGSFSAADPVFASSTPAPSPNVPPHLSGTWSFTFDVPALTGTGAEFFDNLPLTSLTLSPSTIGSTSFNVTNSVGLLGFENGLLKKILIGGDPDGAGISVGTDDWLTQYTIDGSTPTLTEVYAVVVGDSSLSFYNNSSGSVSIPEPATLALLGLGVVAGIPLVRRRRTPS